MSKFMELSPKARKISPLAESSPFRLLYFYVLKQKKHDRFNLKLNRDYLKWKLECQMEIEYTIILKT